ncbi:hypothetical protein [Salininema proteolyticum]|uniref:Secreted protein n=1 Tax=Salininema proteolyticum TaxID=1607685 RepID=A0ABV8TXZ6_9ACTN
MKIRNALLTLLAACALALGAAAPAAADTAGDFNATTDLDIGIGTDIGIDLDLDDILDLDISVSHHGWIYVDTFRSWGHCADVGRYIQDNHPDVYDYDCVKAHRGGPWELWIRV